MTAEEAAAPPARHSCGGSASNVVGNHVDAKVLEGLADALTKLADIADTGTPGVAWRRT